MEMCALHIMMIKQGAESEETQIKHTDNFVKERHPWKASKYWVDAKNLV